MARTKITSNVLAPSAAQTNINNDGSFTLSVPTLINNTVSVSGNLTVDTNTLFVDSVNNRVGIGTTTPQSTFMLDVNGQVVIRGDNYINGSLREFGATAYKLSKTGDSWINGGNVGIGTATPNEKLTVVGNISATGNLTVDTNTLFVDSTNNRVGIGTNNPQQAIDFRPVTFDANQSGGIRFDNTAGQWPCGIYIRSDGVGGPRLSLDAPYQNNTLNLYDNNVGIGTIRPNQKLTVVGNISATGNLTVDTNTLFVDSVNNSVGVGTTSPTAGYILDVKGNGLIYNSSGATTLDIRAGSTQSSTVLQTWRDSSNTILSQMYPTGAMTTQGYALAGQSIISFGANILNFGTNTYWQNLNYGNASTIRHYFTGNIGIGTTSPSAKLHTIATTEQVRFGYDTNNYWNATTNSVGSTTLSAVGSGAKFVISSNVDLENRLSIIKQGINFDYVTKPIAPTLALAGLAGNVPVGTNYYYITYVTADGETEFGNSANITVASAANAQVNVTLPVSSDPKVIARKIYRGTSTAVAGFLATVSDNTTTLYVDNTATVTSNLLYRTRYVGNTTAGNIFADGTKNIEIDSTGALKLASQYNSLRLSKREVVTGTAQAQVVVYNTTDEENNVESGGLSWANNVFEVGTFGRGTGALRKVRLKSSNLSVALNFDLERGGTDWASIIDPGTSLGNTSFVRYNPTTWTASGGENRLLTLGTVALNNTGTGGYSLFNIDATGGTGGTGSKFFTRYTLGGSPIHTIDYQGNGYFAGNVGVGTTTPNEKLTVVGNISATGIVTAEGNKLAAETFAIAMAIAIG